MNSEKVQVEKGRVYWITGLSGAGKTTIAQILYKRLKNVNVNTVFVDGDLLREIFGGDLGHSSDDRRKLAASYGRLCRFLSEQGIDVVCATMSMFHEVRGWNRRNIENYMEIYLKVPIDVLKKRDSKRIYSRVESGEINNVVGVDIPAEEPLAPDFEIVNDGQRTPEAIVDEIIDKTGIFK